MTARRFMVMFDSFPIKEAQVKSGNNTREVIVASRCVNVALFVSGNLRRNVSISIAWGEIRDLSVITFPGETLKRVSPDERSIAFFLLKSTNEASNLSAGQRIVMDNGIEVKRAGFEILLEDWSPSSVYAAQKGTEDSEKAISRKVGVFVYGMGMHENPKASTQIVALPRPPNPERFILDMNLKADMD
jgi:tRNA pseudouridine-54 N-methylase